MWAEKIFISGLMSKSLRFPLELRLMVYQCEGQRMVGALCFAEQTKEGIQCIAELLEMTSKLSPTLFTLPLQIEEVLACGDLTSLDEDENLPF